MPLPDSPRQPRILVVEYDRGGGEDIQLRLTSHTPDVVTAVITASELTGVVAEDAWDVVVMDWTGTAEGSRETLSFLTQWLPDSPTIVVGDRADDVTMRRLLNDGAWDVLDRKDLHRLRHVVTHALENSAQRVARRIAEGERRRSEERYRQVFMNASDPMGVFPLGEDGRPGRFTEVNLATCAMLGYTSDELLRLSPPDLVAEGDRATLPAIFGKLISERRHHVELRLTAKDGREIPVEISGTLFNVEAEPTVLGILTDMTGKKHAAEMYRRATDTSVQRHRVRAMIDAAIVAVFAPAGLILLHYLMPRHPVASWLLLHPPMLDLFIAASFVECGAAIFAFRRYGDLQRQIEKRKRVEDALRDLQGQLEARVQQRTAEVVTANAGLQAEIAERERAEATLRLQATALRVSPDAIVIADRDGRIVWVNPAFTRLTGYTANEACGQIARDLLKTDPEDAERYDEAWHFVAKGEPWSGQLKRRRKDGSRYIEYATITPVTDAAGAMTHIVSIKRDLTQEMQLKEQFLHAQKMESVGRLAGGIAHDFNNLLTVINGTAELASANLTARDPLREDLAEIYRAGTRAAALTRQLLAFSRKQVMKPQVLSLKMLVDNVRSLLQRVIGEDITLVIAPTAVDGVVMADPGQIEQVLMNLVVNSRDAMPAGGTVTIGVAEREIGRDEGRSYDSLECGSYAVLSVTDTGIGMSEETRSHLFEPFFTTKEAGKGTGLGLATVYGIVTQSGGHIRVESEPARGTTFTIYLPRVSDAAKAHRENHAAPASAGAETILVVEDEPALREMLRRMLHGAGYTVQVAANATEALMLLERHSCSVDLLLTDVVMPGMSGPDLAARLIIDRPHTKVLFSSGYADSPAGRQAQRDRHHFIGKPFSRGELLRKVREILDAAEANHLAAHPPAALAS